ncbi:hypothetical protein E2562_037978 [Oryza meyeriana var. granulata]|uniref:F-box/LRR-repeat protein 15/At3g58940/PEG3-like LRR domain-containing protein n=1 Tax=Oryza meyeriana var. granulata TaxID=110450 RepID=A0A6G1CM08_9ORYZ|nr:hypothetical protein E2562_037978 [Oryza meyeriana var. granulata]
MEEDEQQAILGDVQLHLPDMPETTLFFLLGPATASSTPDGGLGSLVSGGADTDPSTPSSATASCLRPGKNASGTGITAASAAEGASCLLPGENPSNTAGPGSTARVFYGDIAGSSVAFDVEGILPGDVSLNAAAASPADGHVICGGVPSDADIPTSPSGVGRVHSGDSLPIGVASDTDTTPASVVRVQDVASHRCPFSEYAVMLLLSHMPIKDIFRFGYVLSREWLSLWQQIPLVFHDLQLAPDHVKQLYRAGKFGQFKIASRVTRVLDLHPGPVEMVRLDSTTWTGGSVQLVLWLHKLIKKGVQELILFGRWPRQDLDVLPSNLLQCTSLQKLHLGFLKVSVINSEDQFGFPHLQKLQLSHCDFQASDLDIVLRRCDVLDELSLGYIKQYVLIIHSNSLKFLILWSCTIDVLAVHDCPKLSGLSQDSERAPYRTLHIQLREVPMLTILSSLYLNHQTIELCGYRIKAGMIEYPVCESMRKLSLVCNFSEGELMLIPALLNSFPNLEKLQITRMDSLESYSGIGINWHTMLSSITCIKMSLKFFQLISCHGDDIEKQLVEAISENATKLSELRTGA